jgi:hypothetical protein
MVHINEYASTAPNAVRISRAATIDRDRLHAMIAQNIGTIASLRSGVGLHALVGRHHAGGA